MSYIGTKKAQRATVAIMAATLLLLAIRAVLDRRYFEAAISFIVVLSWAVCRIVPAIWDQEVRVNPYRALDKDRLFARRRKGR